MVTISMSFYFNKRFNQPPARQPLRWNVPAALRGAAAAAAAAAVEDVGVPGADGAADVLFLRKTPMGWGRYDDLVWFNMIYPLVKLT